MPNYDDHIDNIFRTLADPTRRAVVDRLCEGPATVAELATPFQMALPSFLQHLSILEKGNIITSKKVGRVRTCYLRPDAFKMIEEWLSDRRTLWEKRLDALENYLDNQQLS
ncbi:metalloregulator ArsR/SmtB family transcription factor [uncultured Sneathiella sp.]|uniref:ArsR/SmtB family transcription factor n=1 Tax=uncultured Sneathiella sp. TaxID=879315 RepID=UPI0030EE93F5|tara:strand:+ start:18029 stop:18361 length:333 start_codon:yes stop_codon:yes gene_type:complete